MYINLRITFRVKPRQKLYQSLYKQHQFVAVIEHSPIVEAL